MVTPAWLDLAAKSAEIVGAIAGVLALVFEVFGKRRPESVKTAVLGPSARKPRGWLRLSAGLFVIPLLALIFQIANVVPRTLRAGMDVAAATAVVGAFVAFAAHLLSVRRRRMQLPEALRTLLDRQWEDAQRHQYSYSVGSAPPVLEIYVDQITERLAPPSAVSGVDRAVRLTLAQMCQESRNAIVLADPGVGKSTAIAQILEEQCAWWRAARRSAKPREAPYGPVIPIVLPADLHGSRSLAHAMARQWEHLTGAEVEPGVFQRKPPFGDSWLVLIDGIDQILSTPARTELLARIGAWVADPPLPCRFIITSRPLLSGEIGLLKWEHIGRFKLRRFDAEGLLHFVSRWVAFRESQHVAGMGIQPITVERFMASIKSASLQTLAQVPLIATITALILESGQETSLPSSKAGLYERFVQHLFSSRKLEDLRSAIAPQFARQGKAGERAWVWLLDNLRGLIEGTADLYLSAGSPGVAECAAGWISSNAPAGMFSELPGWADALSGLLTATSLIVPGIHGLRFAHPNFAEYLAAGPRAKMLDRGLLDLETWLADARSPDSRSLALFTLARQLPETGTPQSLADKLVELLLERSGADAYIAGEIVADGIDVTPELGHRIIDYLFEQLSRDELDTGEALRVLINLTTDADVLHRLGQFAGDPAQPDWVRADAAEELCTVTVDTGIQLLRQILAGTSDLLLQYRILLSLDAYGAASSGERARAAKYQSAAVSHSTPSVGVRAGKWYRQTAENPLNEAGQRLAALLAMAERRDPGWLALFEAVIVDPALAEESRLDAARKIMQLAGPDGINALRRAADSEEHTLEVRVPLLAAMAEARDERARQILNQLAAVDAEGFLQRFPSIAAWREEIGVRSSEQRASTLTGQAAELSDRRPAVWGYTPARDKNFTGREDVLARLRAGLTSTATAAMPHTLHGIGGVGKTHIAIEYAHRYASEYDLVWWVPADQPALIRSALAGLVEPLGLVSAASAGIETTARAVLNALRRGEPVARWLLIFDNADQPEEMNDLLPRGPGHVLITSRNQRWRRLTETVPVNVFTGPESTDFLGRLLPRGITTSDAQRLARELGDLPLALEQAAALLAETGMTVDTYLQLLAEHTSRIMAEGRTAEYPRSLTAAWRLGVSMLGQHMSQAVELLRCLAFFGPDPIPIDILKPSTTSIRSDLETILTDPILLSRSIREMGRFGLIDIDERTIKVHRLIQALLRDELIPDTQEAYRHQAHLLLAGAAPGSPDDASTWGKYRELLPHVIPSGIAECPDEAAQQFVLNTSRLLYVSGDLPSSLEIVQNIIAASRHPSAEDSNDILLARCHLGAMLRELGQFREAAEVDAGTRDTMSRTTAKSDEAGLLLGENHGADLRVSGKFGDALNHDLALQHGFAAAFGAKDARTLRASGNLALDYVLVGSYQDAHAILVPTHTEWTTDHENRQADRLRSWTDLARARRLDGAYHEAADLSEDASNYGREALSQEHPRTLAALNEFSVAKRLTGEYELSLSLAEEAYREFIRLYGQDQLVTLAAAVSLANALRVMGRLDESFELASRTVDSYNQILGKAHPFSLASYGNLAVLHRLRGDPAGAREINQRYLAQLETTLSPEHPYALAVATNLASDLAELHQSDTAIQHGEDTLRRWNAVLGEKHPMTLACCANLAIDLRLQDQAEERTSTLLRDAMDGLANILGDEHPHVDAAQSGRRIDCDFDPPRL